MAYTPGTKQTLTVTVTHSGAQLYGFELSARLASDNGQAGTLAPAEGETGIRVVRQNNIEYIQHSPARTANSFRVDWTPPATNAGDVRIFVAANAANGNGNNQGDNIYTAEARLTPQVGQSTQEPRFTSNQVLNGASFLAGMAPGTFISIFGENLAPIERSWDGAIQGTALPSQLEGVSVTVGGKPAFLAFMRPNPAQLNVLLPTDDMTGSVEVKVTTPGGSATAQAVIETHAPAFFLRDPENRRYVAATHADGAVVGKTGLITGAVNRPAQPGQEIVLWGTGFGPTAERVPSGRVVDRPYPIADPSMLRVMIGGTQATVNFAGVTIAGVYQVNAVVPSGLSDGDHPVQAEIGGKRTQDNVFLTVQRPAQSGVTDETPYNPYSAPSQ
jgi:uncharacterized protein (TIGR03437 family)